jgi:hypothetical protein
LAAANFPLYNYLCCTQSGQLLQSLPNRQDKASPGVLQMTDDQISQHDHQGMTASIAFDLYVPWPHLETSRLARAKGLFHLGKVFVAVGIP